MDETYLLAAAKYIEMNPVRAGLVSDPYEAGKAHVSIFQVKEDDQWVSDNAR